MTESASVSRTAGPGARLRRGLGVLAATLGGNLFLVVGSIVFGSLAILVSWIPPRGDWTYRCARMWSVGLLRCSGVRLRVERPAPATGGPFVYMPNHQSLLDIPVVIATLPGQARFLAKRSLFLIPIFGWALLAGGFVPVDRRNRSRAAESFAAAAERLRGGASIVIFPEETRSRTGRLLPFQRGGFLLALKSRAPIVPVGIRGTRALRRPGGVTMYPGTVEIRYGDPLDVSQSHLREKGALVTRVETEVASLLGEPDPEGAGSEG